VESVVSILAYITSYFNTPAKQSAIEHLRVAAEATNEDQLLCGALTVAAFDMRRSGHQRQNRWPEKSFDTDHLACHTTFVVYFFSR
jgi:hypothetical protein